MNSNVVIVLLIVLLLISSGGTYWSGYHRTGISLGGILLVLLILWLLGIFR